jgi:hypothetical protein
MSLQTYGQGMVLQLAELVAQTLPYDKRINRVCCKKQNTNRFSASGALCLCTAEVQGCGLGLKGRVATLSCSCTKHRSVGHLCEGSFKPCFLNAF